PARTGAERRYRPIYIWSKSDKLGQTTSLEMGSQAVFRTVKMGFDGRVSKVVEIDYFGSFI
ncbi:MAG: hypothetical protein IKS55_04940, partial [Oscillospiraceae bacterium]|nr:hypothetical protein [Oscillospiraceae bacterium]